MQAIWSRIGGRTCDVRSHPSVLEYPAKAECGVHDRPTEREISGENPPGLCERQRECEGISFLVDGYCVSTVGLDEGRVRQYIRQQEDHERRQDDLPLDD